MKKLLALLLALVMCLSLCACGVGETENNDVPEEKDNSADSQQDSAPVEEDPVEDAVVEDPELPKLKVGETGATDIAAVTLDWAQLGIALENTWGDDYMLPKEYDAAEDSNNPYVAAVGHTMVSITFTVTNTDRASIDLDGSFNPTFITVNYQGQEFTPETRYGASGAPDEYGLPAWDSYSSMNILLSAGETLSYKCCCDIAVEAASLDDSFEITFTLPNSKGETEDFIFIVDSEGLAAAKEIQDAAKEEAAAAENAALEEALAEIDPETAEAVKAQLQGEWEYTADDIYYEIAFNGDNISVVSTVAGMQLANSGTYSVRKEYIYIEYENGATAGIPYTFENGELAMFYLIGF